MPISGIVTQPASDHLMAAYRPIILEVGATASMGPSAVPPVVYCDIYFAGVFYKTIKKTATLANGNWRFDIQDAAQEYLGKYLAAVYGQAIVEAPPLIAISFCRFRSSGLDTEGFIVPDPTIPVQATGNTNPTAGTGTQSNSFYVVNSTLQHDQAQDLADHLDAWKNPDDTWDVTTYPLTHRPRNYFLCTEDSDYFPILTDKTPTGLSITYTNKDGTTGSSESDEICVPIGTLNPTLPNGSLGDPYSVSIPLSGTAPFALDSFTGPSWMSAEIDGSNLVLTGTPDATGTGISVSATVSNCEGPGQSFTKTISVTTCVAVTIGGSTFMPDATAGVPYNKTFPLSGTPPFAIDSFTGPAWITAVISGSTLQLFGTPADAAVGSAISVSVDLINCSSGAFSLDTTINVLPSANFVLQGALNFKFDSVSGTGAPAIGPTTVNGQVTGHQAGLSANITVTITGTVVTPCMVVLLINGSPVSCQQISTIIGTSIFAVSYLFTAVTATESDIVKFTINAGICS
jgi:hypothetical protein